jgi:MYXO-CTERM domain-containing protein
MCAILHRIDFPWQLLSRRELRAVSADPGETKLKITPALLLCGAVLIVAAPLWANRIESEHGSTIDEFSADSAPAAAFAGAPAGAFSERFEPKLTMDARDARVGIPSFNVDVFESRELAFIFSRDFSRDAFRDNIRDNDRDVSREKDVRRDENEGSGNNSLPKTNGGVGSALVTVSEPGLLPLLLAGLAAIGFWSRRRELA